jgi:uncharacterized protein YjbI with pentapeptide repeats
LPSQPGKTAVANAAHLKLINRGVKRWNQWRKVHPSEAMDLSGVDLSAADLSGVNFIGVNLTGAILKRANLKGAVLKFANLSRSDFSGADLTEADLNSARLIQANLAQAQLYKADLCRIDGREADLSQAWGEQSFLIEANLAQANLISANFSQAILTEVNLQGANLSRANLSKADLSFINLRLANLTQANLSKVICVEGNLSNTNLSSSNLYCANCQRTNFREALLLEADLSGGNFGSSDFTHADLSLAHLIEVKVVNTLFDSAKLQGIRWTGADLGAMPQGVELDGVQWSLPAAEFSEELKMPASLVIETSASAEKGIALLHDVLVQVKDDTEIAQYPETDLSLILDVSIPTPVNWVALAIALHQINQVHPSMLMINQIEAQSGERTVFRLSINHEDLSLEDLESNLVKRYESLCITLSQTLPPNLNGRVEIYTAGIMPNLSSINQLLNLLISNLI